MEDCTPPPETPSVHDFSKLKLIPVNDTHTFINGTWTFLKDIKSPWPVHITAEHFHRGHWTMRAFNRLYKDWCFSMKNPMEPFYFGFKNFQDCPIKAGVSKFSFF